MGIRRLNDLATTKAYLEVDDVDLIRANTDNTWPITARYVSGIVLSVADDLEPSRNVRPRIRVSDSVDGSYLPANTIEVSMTSGLSNANVIVSLPYYFDIGSNIISWVASNATSNSFGNVTSSDFVSGSNVGNIAVISAYGAGNVNGNISLAPTPFSYPGTIEQDHMTIDIYSGAVISEPNKLITPAPYFNIRKRNLQVDFIWNSAGTVREWIVPDGLYIVGVLVIGGGGGGGSGVSAISPYGGGGGGGALTLRNYNVTPGDTLYINVGAGGQYGSYPGGLGTAGGRSFVCTSSGFVYGSSLGGVIALANGGQGGQNNGNAGSGGANSYVTTGGSFSGGDGATNYNPSSIPGAYGIGGGAGHYANVGTTGNLVKGVAGPGGSDTHIWGWDGNTQSQTTIATGYAAGITNYISNVAYLESNRVSGGAGGNGNLGQGNPGIVRIFAGGAWELRNWTINPGSNTLYYSDWNESTEVSFNPGTYVGPAF